MARIAEAALLLLVAGLAVALALPWPEKGSPSAHRVATAAASDAPGQNAARMDSADPEAVARLFGWTRPLPRPAVEPEPTPEVVELPPVAETAAPPIVAEWLRYVGYSSDAEGASLYYLKDTRSGKLITATEGSVSAEWSLLQASEEQLVVRHDGTDYLVHRR